MRRTLFLCALPTGVLAWNWLRLESPRAPLGSTLLLVLVAIAPALSASWRGRVAALGLASVFAVHLTLGGWLAGPHPLRPLAHFANGFADFYAVRLPLNRFEHARMHGVLLLALFASCAVLALAIAARRPLGAALALLVGAGWPATLLTGGDLERGTVLLLALLLLLFGLRGRPDGRIGRALATAALLALAASATATSSTVARGQVLDWQNWGFSSAPAGSVSVRYVWGSNYDRLTFPKKVTTVLRITAPRAPSYWRATTLDAFDGVGWKEDLLTRIPSLDEATRDPLLPRRARDPRDWTQQQVTVEALADNHLVAAELPVAYRLRRSVAHPEGGRALASDVVPRGTRYDVWSYQSRPSAIELIRSKPIYPALLEREREVWPGLMTPPLGTPGRRRAVEGLFRRGDPTLASYRPLYETARGVVGDTQSPYAAALALEAWFRSPAFRYDGRPPAASGPPLVAFLTETRRGYCQHFAGAMALMLRYLGVPARVGAGFTSGSYNRRDGEWRVTDHDAHTWVEVWFQGYGWLPFDPTPGRGELRGRYTASSPQFSITGALLGLAVKGAGAQAALGISRKHLTLQGARKRGAQAAAAAVPGTRKRHQPSPLWSLLRFLLLLGLSLLVCLGFLKLALRRSRYLRPHPRAPAAAAIRELADFVADQGLVTTPSMTATELADRIELQFAVPAAPFAQAAAAARYGPPERTSAEAERLRREVRTLRRGLRRSLTRLERIRGLLSLRSLGLAN